MRLGGHGVENKEECLEELGQGVNGGWKISRRVWR